MAAEKAFLLPVVIDKTTEAEALVPERFREVQWTRLPEGSTPPGFVERVRRLLYGGPPVAHRLIAEAEFARVDQRSGRNLPRRILLPFVGLGVLIATGYFISERFLLPSRTMRTLATAAVTEPNAAAPRLASGTSIAVLPFLDLSENRDEGYFSDGISEEIIDLLAQIPNLQVIARTSAFYFKGKHVTIAEVARTLGVGQVLEGSVGKAGNTVRVTAQLIRATRSRGPGFLTPRPTLRSMRPTPPPMSGRA